MYYYSPVGVRAGLAAAADAIRRLQGAEKEKLELTAARHLGAFRPDTDAATAHLERRSREVVAGINEALADLACELYGDLPRQALGRRAEHLD